MIISRSVFHAHHRYLYLRLLWSTKISGVNNLLPRDYQVHSWKSLIHGFKGLILHNLPNFRSFEKVTPEKKSTLSFTTIDVKLCKNFPDHGIKNQWIKLKIRYQRVWGDIFLKDPICYNRRFSTWLGDLLVLFRPNSPFSGKKLEDSFSWIKTRTLVKKL